MKKVLLIITALLFIWVWFIEPNRLDIKTISLKITGLKGLKVVFVSDFHIKQYQEKRLKKIIQVINNQNPDLILSTGDFVSGHLHMQTLPIEKIAENLSKLKPKYGFYAVLGNHDWWQGGEEIEQTLEKKGIVVLDNENKTININGIKLYIAGVEDITTRSVDLKKTFKNTEKPTVLLTHSPDVFPFTETPEYNNIILTLAGHTHGGQVSIPFIGPIVVPSIYGKKYASGIINENGKVMFVTKGIGTSILPVRFNCLPEIVVINFN